MQLDVRAQAALLGKGFLAEWAAEGLLPCVRPHVLNLVRLLDERLLADTATERSLSRVGSSVCFEGGKVPKLLRTHRAAVGHLLGVLLPHVCIQVALLGKGYSTESATEGLLSGVCSHVLFLMCLLGKRLATE